MRRFQKFVQIAKKRTTAEIAVVSPNFLVWKFCGHAQFPHSFWQFARNYAETVPVHKIFTLWNYLKLRHFSNAHCIKTYPNTEFFWSVFPRNLTEYGYLLCIYPYSVRIQGNRNQAKLHILTHVTKWQNETVFFPFIAG